MNIGLYIGVDPGKSGAFAAINNDGEVVEVLPMPIAGKEVDLDAISSWIYDLTKDGTRIVSCIEKVASRPNQGTASMFTFGYNTGIVHGIFAAFEIPRYIVLPTKWQREILSGTTKNKADAIQYCRRVYPYVDLMQSPRSKTFSSGIADAICIAEYIYRELKYGANIRQ